MGRARRGCLAGVLVIAIGAGGIGAATVLLNRNSPAPPARCTAMLDGTPWGLDPEQASYAAVIAGVALQRGLPARAVTIALATALQESGLRNLDHGDRDSLGLFQQRPSQGWGTAEQVQDPVYAAGKFYDGLVRVDGWETMAVTEAAQAVQRSAYPDAYAQHETKARAWASALTGWSTAALVCTHLPDAVPAQLTDVATLSARDLAQVATWTAGSAGAGSTSDGSTDAASAGGGTLTTTGADADRLAWASAQWAVATASVTGVRSVTVDTKVWTGDGWDSAKKAADPGVVTVAPGP